MITARKATRAAKAALPAWMIPLFGVCLVIPGPFDEAAMLITVLVMMAVQPQRFCRARSAWRGGKSHRQFDLAGSIS